MDETAETRLAAARESIASGSLEDADLEILASHGNLEDLSTLISRLPETEVTFGKLLRHLLERDAPGVIDRLSAETTRFNEAESPAGKLVTSAFTEMLGESHIDLLIRLTAASPENGLAQCALDACRALAGDSAEKMARILTGRILGLEPDSKEREPVISLFSAFGESAIKEIKQAMELAWDTDREKLENLITELEPKPEIKEDPAPAAESVEGEDSPAATKDSAEPTDSLTIAIYNAAFDPIHIFHLRAAQHILNEKVADRVIFVPKGNPRGEREMAPDADRIEMLRLATAGISKIEVSDFEIAGGEQVRSFEVLEAIEKQYSEEGKELSLSLIVGQETLSRMPRWRIFREMLDRFGVLVVPRGKKDADRIISGTPALRRYRKNIRILKFPFEFELSSTYLRDSVADGKDIRFLVPGAVRDYIIEKELYRTRYKSRPPYERPRRPVRRPASGPKRFHWCAPGDEVEGTKINLAESEGEFAVFNPQEPLGDIPVPGMDENVADSVDGIWQGLKIIHGRIDTRFFKGRGRKRRAHGRIEGHKFGDETLDYVEARRMIFIPCYIYVVKNRCKTQVKMLVERLKDGEVIFLHDSESNPDVENTSSTLSHAAVLVDYLNGEVLGLKPGARSAGNESGAADKKSPDRQRHRRGERRGRRGGSSRNASGARKPARKGYSKPTGHGTGGFSGSRDNEIEDSTRDDVDDSPEIWDPENL